MNKRTLAVVAALAVIAAILALVGHNVGRDQGNLATSVGALFLPDLGANLDRVDEVYVIGAGDARLATLTKTDDGWVVAEQDDYRADIGKLRAALTALTEARIVEEKTSDAAFYSRLSVEPIDAADATGEDVRIRAGGETLADVVLGDTSGTKYRFARKADDATSYLIDRDPDVPRESAQWVVPDIVDVPSARVQRVEITHSDGEKLVVRKDNREASNFTVEAVPEGRELQYASVANVIGGALRELKLNAVVRADPDADEPSVVSEFWTFDGLVVTISGFERDDESWITVAARFDAPQATEFATEPVEEGAGKADVDEDAPDPMAEADTINARVDGWRYRIPAHQYDQMTRRMSDLLKAVDTE